MSNKNEAIKVAVEALRLLVKGQSSAEILDNLGLNDDYLLELADALESSVEGSDEDEDNVSVHIEVSSENALETLRDTKIRVRVYENEDAFFRTGTYLFEQTYTGYTLKYAVEQIKEKFKVSRKQFVIWELYGGVLCDTFDSKFDSIFA